MHDNQKICLDLTVESRCFVLEQYEAGKMVREFHQHVDKRRMSRDGAIETIRGLVVRYYDRRGMTGDMIVAAHCNSRKGLPRNDGWLKITATYSEPGVQRLYCGTNTLAWFDEVIAPDSFRSWQMNG